MRVIHEVIVGGKSVQIKELTVAEIRQWLAALKNRDDVVDSMLFEEVSLPDLSLITSLTAEDIDALPPSEIEKLFADVKAINPRFFAMREKLAEMGMQIAQAQAKAGQPSLNLPLPD